MRVLLFAAGVFGLALLFGHWEQAPAAATPVTSQDVRLVSEHMSSSDGLNGAGKNGIAGLGRPRGFRR